MIRSTPRHGEAYPIPEIREPLLVGDGVAKSVESSGPPLPPLPWKRRQRSERPDNAQANRVEEDHRGESMGSVIRKNLLMGPAPSTAAAS